MYMHESKSYFPFNDESHDSLINLRATEAFW